VGFCKLACGILKNWPLRTTVVPNHKKLSQMFLNLTVAVHLSVHWKIVSGPSKLLRAAENVFGATSHQCGTCLRPNL